MPILNLIRLQLGLKLNEEFRMKAKRSEEPYSARYRFSGNPLKNEIIDLQFNAGADFWSSVSSNNMQSHIFFNLLRGNVEIIKQ